MGKRKTAAERADDERRYALARAARTDEDFEPLLVDPNQGIRSTAATNGSASAAVLDRFAQDTFWGVRVAVAQHPNTSRETLLGLLERDTRQRGVVHTETRRRLEADGVTFGDDGMPAVD